MTSIVVDPKLAAFPSAPKLAKPKSSPHPFVAEFPETSRSKDLSSSYPHFTYC